MLLCWQHIFKLETQLFKEINTVINRKLLFKMLWFGHLSTVTITSTTCFFFWNVTVPQLKSHFATPGTLQFGEEMHFSNGGSSTYNILRYCHSYICSPAWPKTGSCLLQKSISTFFVAFSCEMPTAAPQSVKAWFCLWTIMNCFLSKCFWIICWHALPIVPLWWT